jgi:hypothetical protein
MSRSTPEGKVKRKIKELLDRHKPLLYYHMPVLIGMGRPTLDFIGCYRGRFFGIEAKREDGDGQPTTRQKGTMEDIERAGGVAFVVHDQASLQVFENWLAKVRAR